jgi:ZIP family zinc transporter
MFLPNRATPHLRAHRIASIFRSGFRTASATLHLFETGGCARAFSFNPMDSFASYAPAQLILALAPSGGSLALMLGFATVLSTLMGGVFAIRKRDKLHLILGFSAGAVIGVAFFDLLPEAIELSARRYPVSGVTTIVAIGFLSFMLLSRFILLHPHSSDDQCEEKSHQGELGAASLSIHSFLDGAGIGLAFQVSNAAGIIVAAAVLAHDFSDGINTVGLIMRRDDDHRKAYAWLAVDALAPLIGILSTRFFSLLPTQLGMVLALFCGFFLYIGASDLLPESHHRHPKMVTSAMTVLGTLAIYLAIQCARF